MFFTPVFVLGKLVKMGVEHCAIISNIWHNLEVIRDLYLHYVCNAPLNKFTGLENLSVLF